MTLAARRPLPLYLAFLFALLATRTDELAIVSDNRTPPTTTGGQIAPVNFE